MPTAAQKAAIIDIINKDAEIRNAYMDLEGRTCFIGGLGVAAGYVFERYDPEVDYRKVFNEETQEYEEEEFTPEPAGWKFNDVAISSSEGCYEVEELRDLIREQFGLTSWEQQNLQRINDKTEDHLERRIRLINAVNELPTNPDPEP